jgi:hypothetical protein
MSLTKDLGLIVGECLFGCDDGAAAWLSCRTPGKATGEGSTSESLPLSLYMVRCIATNKEGP